MMNNMWKPMRGTRTKMIINHQMGICPLRGESSHAADNNNDNYYDP